mmetsp:Transcript_29355/g.35767  ORF Transcript_29355/g.35767 Transcript_29355/m.35767 type:complete len:118 (+) Transcript_29355:103-456(+)
MKSRNIQCRPSSHPSRVFGIQKEALVVYGYRVSRACPNTKHPFNIIILTLLVWIENAMLRAQGLVNRDEIVGEAKLGTKKKKTIQKEGNKEPRKLLRPAPKPFSTRTSFFGRIRKKV